MPSTKYQKALYCNPLGLAGTRKACTTLTRIDSMTRSGLPASMAITQNTLATETYGWWTSAYDTHLLSFRPPVRSLTSARVPGYSLCQCRRRAQSDHTLDPQRGDRLWSGPAPDAFPVPGGGAARGRNGRTRRSRLWAELFDSASGPATGLSSASSVVRSHSALELCLSRPRPDRGTHVACHGGCRSRPFVLPVWLAHRAQRGFDWRRDDGGDGLARLASAWPGAGQPAVLSGRDSGDWPAAPSSASVGAGENR